MLLSCGLFCFVFGVVSFLSSTGKQGPFLEGILDIVSWMSTSFGGTAVWDADGEPWPR